MRSLLVLWDVDYTLVATDGVGKHLYEVVLPDLTDTGVVLGAVCSVEAAD